MMLRQAYLEECFIGPFSKRPFIQREENVQILYATLQLIISFTHLLLLLL